MNRINLLLRRGLTTTTTTTPSLHTALSNDLEFCCFSFGYSTGCTTCPFPSTLRPYFESSTVTHFISTKANKERKEACFILGINYKDLKTITPNELKRIFRTIAFDLHPDTRCSTLQPSKANKKFKNSFESFVLLRTFLETTRGEGGAKGGAKGEQ